MTKKVIGLLALGMLIAFGCSRETAREQMNPTAPLTNAPPIHLDAAMAQAAAEHKMVLLDFTGSDWCGPCMQLHSDVFARPEFESYAQSNLVFLTVDFPSKYQFSPETAATNDWLAKKFDVNAFPTLIALDSHGNRIWRHVGFIGVNGPKEWIETLNAVKLKTE
jgi:thioredoxin-related protein